MERLIELNNEGILTFNWDFLPDHVRTNIELRDKIFAELQEKIKPNQVVDVRKIFEVNQYAINRIYTCLKEQKKLTVKTEL